MRFTLGVLAVALLHFIARFLMMLVARNVGGSYAVTARVLGFPLSQLRGTGNPLLDGVLLSLAWGLVIYSLFRLANR